MTTPTGGAQHDLAAIEDLAIRAATRAARFIVTERVGEQHLGVSTKSSGTDVVTVMDSRSQELVFADLRAARPQDAVFGEEDGADEGDAVGAASGGASGRTGLTWVVDPIDGTVNYMYGFPQYAVSVAAVEGDPRVTGGWRPVAGAVVDALTGTVYHARAGGGAHARTADGTSTPMHVTHSADLATSLVATGFGYDPDKRVRQARALTEVIGSVRDIRRGGSAALDLCHVAGGRVDGYYEMGVNAWDIAAGWIVLTEAGGVITGADGAPPSTTCVVAAGVDLHPHLAGLVGSVLHIVHPG